MSSECHLNFNQHQLFDPDQIIDLNCKMHDQGSKFTGKNYGKIDLSQKINLKQHTGINQKNAATNSLNCRKMIKDELQKQQVGSNQKSNLDIYSYAGTNEIDSKANETQNQTFSQNSKPSQVGNLAQLDIKQESGQVNYPQKMQQIKKTQNIKKYKISIVGSDFISMRYECFCSRQYFTYSSTYNHLQREHIEFLKQNRRFSYTNVYETNHPVYGYRIKKIMRERLKCLRGQQKSQVQRLTLQTKEKIKAQSLKMQALLSELRAVEDQRQEQIHILKLLEKRFLKESELIRYYRQMIFAFQKIFEVLNIKQITKKLNSGPTVFYQQSNQQDIDYFPD